IELLNQFVSEDVIRIERKYPWSLNCRMFQSEVPLLLMRIEYTLKGSHLTKLLYEGKRFIGTETVDQDDVAGPTQLSQTALDIWRFIVSEYEGCDLIEHQSCKRARQIMFFQSIGARP